MKKIFISEGSLKMGRNRNRTSENLDEICNHNTYCILKKLRERETCYIADTKKCETYKFYNKENGKRNF